MTRVIKIGGRAQQDPQLAATLAASWHASAGALCVVHGGGDEVSALQRRLGIEPVFVGGRRVTSEDDIGLIRMILSGTVNKRLVAALVSCGVPAVGVSGEDAALIAARPLDGTQLGRVGAAERVDGSLLCHLMDGGFLPVISPVSRDSTSVAGAALNVNGDDGAAAIATALGAQELFFMADVDGVLLDGAVQSMLEVDVALELIGRGTAAGGMAAKLQAGIAALEGGVESVRIGSLSALNDARLGTALVPARSFV